MLLHHSLVIVPLLQSVIAISADDVSSRLGSSRFVNSEEVGEGLTFESAEHPPIDRERLLQEAARGGEDEIESELEFFDSQITDSSEEGVEEVGEVKLFSLPITRRLRKVGSPVDMAKKESFRDMTIPMLESFVEDDRQLQACPQGQKYFKLSLTTDNFGFENSWTLKKDDDIIQMGPPNDTKYADNTQYEGGFCLDAGNYVFSIKDQYNDGMCCSNGEGSYQVFLDDIMMFASPSKDIAEEWGQRDHTFTISENDVAEVDINDPEYEDSLSSIARRTSCSNVKIEFKIDKYGDETSVYLKNKSTGKAVMSSVKEVGAYQTKTLQECVAPGTYTFSLQDVDGICCQNGKGYYKLSVDGTPLVNGGFFLGSKSYTIKVGYDYMSTMNSRDKEWLTSHNSRRREYHQNAGKSYRALRYSQALASDAKRYAGQLLNSCDTNGIKHESGVEEGENLAKNKGSGTWGSLYPADKIVKRWVDYEADDPYPHNAHLTQVIWYSTGYVGCGESVKDFGSGKCRVQVCRYARAGNCNVKNGNWKAEAFRDDTNCGSPCPSEGCYA